MCTVGPCGELRASLGCMGFAASLSEPLLAAVCTPSQEGWRGASLLQAPISATAHPPLPAAGSALGHPALPGCSRAPVPSGSFLCHCCGTRSFLSCHIPGGIRTICTLCLPWGRGQLGEEMWLTLVAEGLSLEGLSQVTCPGVHVGCGAGTPPDASPPVFAHILNKPFPARTRGAAPWWGHMGHVTEPVPPLMGKLLVLSRAEPAECPCDTWAPAGQPGLSPCCTRAMVPFLLAVLPAQSRFLPAARGPARCWRLQVGETAVLRRGLHKPTPAHSGRFGRVRERSKQLQVCVGWRFLPHPHRSCPLPQEFPACFCPW